MQLSCYHSVTCWISKVTSDGLGHFLRSLAAILARNRMPIRDSNILSDTSPNTVSAGLIKEDNMGKANFPYFAEKMASERRMSGITKDFTTEIWNFQIGLLTFQWYCPLKFRICVTNCWYKPFGYSTITKEI